MLQQVARDPVQEFVSSFQLGTDKQIIRKKAMTAL